MTSPAKSKLPYWAEELFKPHRYKILYGGRGSGKSWAAAKALLLLGAMRKERILCAREVQKSIRDSVKRLLDDQIQELGLGSHYQSLETEIRGKNGTEIIFTGLSNQTADSVKSYEGVSRVWIEEGQTVSKKSWDILIPTIRKEGSEIWVTFNPDLDTDETYRRFVTSPPHDSYVNHVNWSENPWFPDVLEKERQHCLLTNKDEYDNIWEGKTKAAVSGAIYARELEAATIAGRIREVPHDPACPVHCILDLGWNDAMTVIMVQKVASELRVIDYIEESFKTLDWYVGEVRRRYNLIGEWWLPHDGEHKDYKTGKSAKELMEGYGCVVQINPRLSIEEGIKHVRMTFPRIYFDKTKTARLVECIKRYRRSINSQTQEPGGPVHDEFSHGNDALRYLAMCADQLGLHEQKTSHPIFQQQAAGLNLARFGAGGASRAGY
jgi:phage terminase large subunit